MDRRSLLDDDGRATPAQERDNVFSDDFEDDFDFAGVADGFRPNVERETDSAARQDDVPIRTVSAHYATHPVIPNHTRGPSRDSTRKATGEMNPFANPDDDEPDQHERPQSLEFEPDNLARRSVSSASSHVYAQTSTPRFGAGPSHPYGMYQQGTMARTLSVTTTSTIRPPPRQSLPQSTPQHPYALYPQGVDDTLDDDDLYEDESIRPVRQNPVTVGFPGLSQGYTRRIGPDGEDQDIIGEDGHTEQLPPYSRYPDDAPEKAPLLVPTALHSRAPVAGTDPGMPLMHTTLLPSSTSAVQSMTDVSELDRQASRGSMANQGLLSSTLSNGSSSLMEKKSWREKNWKERRNTRVCKIPCLWIMLAITAIIFVLAVIGGAVGGFVAGNKHALQSVPTVTYIDASPIPSPTGAPPPKGTWALALGPPEEPDASCLVSSAQAAAWACNLAPNAALGLIVDADAGGNPTGASIFYASYDSAIGYGAQLSYMNTTFAGFDHVRDNDDPNKGPAFYFQQYYDKVVVIPENAITVSSSKSKERRQGWLEPGFQVPGAWGLRKQVIPAGDQPWFCVWNNTFLEAFIYIQENAIVSTTTSLSTSTPLPSSNSSFSLSYPPASTAPSPSAGMPTPPPSIITSVFAPQWTTTTYVGPASGYSAFVSEVIQEAKSRPPWAMAEREPSYEQEHHQRRKRQVSSSDPWNKLQIFPYLIKIEERRVQNNPDPAYCQKYQILNDGTAGPLEEIIYLQEQDPDVAVSSSARMARRDDDDDDYGGCHCQWMSGQ